MSAMRVGFPWIVVCVGYSVFRRKTSYRNKKPIADSLGKSLDDGGLSEGSKTEDQKRRSQPHNEVKKQDRMFGHDGINING